MRKVFLDIGGHHGTAIDSFATRLGLDQSWEIHCYEPNPACHLRDRLRRDPLPILVHDAAIWIEDGEIEFRQQNHVIAKNGSPTDGRSDVDGWGSCLAAVHSRHPALQPAITVPCIDLARLLLSFASEDHIVIKLDVEGAEFAILRHLLAKKAIGRVNELFVEWHERLLPDESVDSRDYLMALLRKCGVSVVLWT